MAIDPTLVLGGIKLLGGLFGKKKADPTPADNLMSQAQGARDAAAKYGFNPLTMLQYGQTGGAMGGGGAPPLASTELLMGGLADIGDVLSGEKAQRVAANKLQTDLAQIKLDQFRSSAAAKVGAGSSVFGVRPKMVAGGGSQVNLSLPIDGASGRGVKVAPVENISGLMGVNNDLTSQETVTVPGSDGDIMGIDELATVVAIGGPQLAYKKLRKTALAARAVSRNAPPKFKIDLNFGRPVPPQNKRNLTSWPFEGLNPFSDAYKD